MNNPRMNETRQGIDKRLMDARQKLYELEKAYKRGEISYTEFFAAKIDFDKLSREPMPSLAEVQS
jgi:archaellum component FlaC